MDFTFEKAASADLDTAFAIARSVVGTKYSHWDAEYPSKKLLAGDIARGELYLLREGGKPVAMIAILAEVGDNIVKFPWPEASPSSCMLARLAILPEEQGRGLATRVMRLAADAARAEGFVTARLLATGDNPLTNHIYRKLGYRARGKAMLWGDEFIGYDLAL